MGVSGHCWLCAYVMKKQRWHSEENSQEHTDQMNYGVIAREAFDWVCGCVFAYSWSLPSKGHNYANLVFWSGEKGQF